MNYNLFSNYQSFKIQYYLRNIDVIPAIISDIMLYIPNHRFFID